MPVDHLQKERCLFIAPPASDASPVIGAVCVRSDRGKSMNGARSYSTPNSRPTSMFSALMQLQNPSGIPPPAGGTLTLPGARLVCRPPAEQRAFSGPALGSGGESTCPGTGKAPAASRIARPASSRHDASPPFARKNRAGKAAGWHRPRRRNSEALAGRPLSPSLRPRPAKVGARLPNASPFPQNTIIKEKKKDSARS